MRPNWKLPELIIRIEEDDYNGERGAEFIKETLDRFEKKAKERLYGK